MELPSYLVLKSIQRLTTSMFSNGLAVTWKWATWLGFCKVILVQPSSAASERFVFPFHIPHHALCRVHSDNQLANCNTIMAGLDYWKVVSSPDSSPCAMRGNSSPCAMRGNSSPCAMRETSGCRFKYFGAVFWKVGIPIRLASWINHVTSHVLTMVTHLRQKNKVNAEEIERALKAHWAHFLWGSTVGG